MKKMLQFLQKIRRDETGATATEYAVMLVLIIVVALAAITLLGQQVNEGFQSVADAISAAS